MSERKIVTKMMLLAALAVGVALRSMSEFHMPDRRMMGVIFNQEEMTDQPISPPGTIVTAYFDINSKHSHESYSTWMANILSLQDPMVIYTTPDMVPSIEKLRSHAPALTKIIPMELNDMKMAAYGEQFWQHQNDLDPEKDIHRSYYLYWIWNEKLELLRKTIEENPFQSNFFAWMDIGYLRTPEYNNKVMLQQIPATLKDDQILGLDVSEYVKISQYMGGGFIGGYKAGLMRFHNAFYTLLENNKDVFIGKDQEWFRRACVENEGMCVLIKPDKNHGNPWFFMAPFMMGLTGENPEEIVVDEV